MKKLSLIIFIIGLSINAYSQGALKNILNKVGNKSTTTQSTTGNNNTGLIPTNFEIGDAIKQALELGVSAGADRLSLNNGFLGNAAVKILMPKEVQVVEKRLRAMGLNSLCDSVITTLNRAAESAAVEAKPIFVAAVKNMTLADAKNLLLGNNDAATQYFKKATTSELAKKFSPIIDQKLNKVGATKYYSQLTTSYNKLPLVSPVKTDLTAYVTEKAIDGMFIEIAKEELKIRDSELLRNTSVLKKVFGYADKN